MFKLVRQQKLDEIGIKNSQAHPTLVVGLSLMLNHVTVVLLHYSLRGPNNSRPNREVELKIAFPPTGRPCQS